MLFGILFCQQLLLLIHTPDILLADSKLYLDIYLLGLPFVFYYNAATGIFSALGDSKTPFIFLACSSISNIAVDILFVTVFKMGVAGVAWATLICQGVSCILAMFFVFARLRKIKTQGKVNKFSWPMLKRIALVAIPSILQQSFVSVGNIIIQSIINSFGPAVIAGSSAAIKLNSMVLTSITTLGNGISNFTAQNLGARKFDRIHAGFKAGLCLVWLICIPLVFLYFLAGRYLVYLFLDSPVGEAIQTGALFLQIVSPFYVIIAAKLIADGVLRGVGSMKKFVISTFADLTLRVLLAVILSATPLGSAGIWMAWPSGWIIATILSLSFYKMTIQKQLISA